MLFLTGFLEHPTAETIRHYWRELCKEMTENNLLTLQALAGRKQSIGQGLVWQDKLTIEEFVSLYGLAWIIHEACCL
jgi:hypothetical protein